jgi:GNAT superfamily N-acetyltransferase
VLSAFEPCRIRKLSATGDTLAVRDLYHRAADYVLLETGLPPNDETVEEFFADCPPNSDLAASHKLGAFLADDELVAIADLAFGYPEPTDAYIGLMLIDPKHRGKGLGGILVEHLTAAARANNAGRMLIAVLDGNPRGRAFWEREGFRLERTFPPVTIGGKSHIRHRMHKPLHSAQSSRRAFG